MARGYPDFFGTPTFPEYGQVVQDLEALVNVAGGGTEDIIDLRIKGRIQGGWIYVGSVGSIRLDEWIITIDGTEFEDQPNWYFALVYAKTKAFPIICSYASSDWSGAYFWLDPDWNFGTQLRLQYHNFHAVNTTVQIELYYNWII